MEEVPKNRKNWFSECGETRFVEGGGRPVVTLLNLVVAVFAVVRCGPAVKPDKLLVLLLLLMLRMRDAAV